MKADGIFDFIEKKDLTSLEILFNHRENRFFLRFYLTIERTGFF
jgi:hypothetical protein